METLLKALADRLKAYNATYDAKGYYGYLILGDIKIEVEINVRKVAVIENKRFLHGSRRGYDHYAMIGHILQQLPRLQERAAAAKKRQAEQLTVKQNVDACRDLTKLVNDKRIRVTFDEYGYDKDDLKYTLTFKSSTLDAIHVATDMVREIEDWMVPKTAHKTQGPMRFSFSDTYGDPVGEELTLRRLAEAGYDLDAASMLVVGETLEVEADMKIVRIS